MAYTLQIVHTPKDGGMNVIEMHYDKMHQAEAEQRRHGKLRHTAVCETFVFQEAEDAVGD